MIKLSQEILSADTFLKIWKIILYYFGRISFQWRICLLVTLGISVFYSVKRYKRKKLVLIEAFSHSIIPSYVLLILVLTIFIRRTSPKIYYELMPFWSYINIYKNGSVDLIIDNIFNIMIFVPLGFLMMCAKYIRNRKLEWQRFRLLLFQTAVFSLVIELIQLVSRHGCCEFDDIINNVIGAAFGGLVYMMLTSFRKERT